MDRQKCVNRTVISLGCIAVAFGLCVLSAIRRDLGDLWFFVALVLAAIPMCYLDMRVRRRWGNRKSFYLPNIVWSVAFYALFFLIAWAGLEEMTPSFLGGFYWWNTWWAPLGCICFILSGCIECFLPSRIQAWRKERIEILNAQ
ncbi:hypothetical protein [Trueperella sp. LYQ141]|uniref:hypothetical protein n=1 Tax=Trueperella sp. LYQ141 TaxID=3391058 RepID=UPI00398357FD